MSELIIGYIINLFILFIVIFIVFRRTTVGNLFSAFLYTFLLLIIALVNFQFNIIEQKYASELAFDLFKGKSELGGQTGFLLQCILNIPVFFATNAWWSAITTNIVLFGGIFWYTRTFGSKFLSFILLAPAVVNFSMFSLRDPIIAALLFVFTLFFVENSTRIPSVKVIVTGSLFLISRPEVIAIGVTSKIVQYLIFIKNKTYLIFLIPLMIVVSVKGLTYVPLLLGVGSASTLANLPDTLMAFYESRSMRWGGSGEVSAGSNILDGNLVTMPFLYRYPIQVLIFFVLPLPFEIKSLPYALSFIDSFVFCFVAFKFHKRGNKHSIILFWCYVLLVSFFSNNYGNVFRMRLPAYFIMLAGLIKSKK